MDTLQNERLVIGADDWLNGVEDGTVGLRHLSWVFSLEDILSIIHSIHRVVLF